MYFGLCWVVAALRLSPVAVLRLLFVVASLAGEHGALGRTGSAAVVRGLVAPWLMASSWVRERTRVPCIGRWILNHWTTGKPSARRSLNKGRSKKSYWDHYWWLVSLGVSLKLSS